MSTDRAQNIFRNASPTNPYAQIMNAALRDGELTPGAGWVLVYCLSLPPTASVTVAGLMRNRNMGRDAVRNAVKELERFGYCRRTRMRNPDGTVAGYEWQFTDRKNTFNGPSDREVVAPEEPAPEIQAVEPAPEKPAPVKPGPGNPHPINTIRVNTKNNPPTPQGGRRRGLSNLPTDWQPSPELRDWSLKQRPDHSRILAAEIEKFRGHWHGTGKQMKDWDATWRKWWITACERPAPKGKFDMGNGRVPLASVAKPGMTKDQIFAARAKQEDALDRDLRAPIWGSKDEDAVRYRADTPEFNARVSQLIRDGEHAEAERVQQRGWIQERPSKLAGLLAAKVIEAAGRRA